MPINSNINKSIIKISKNVAPILTHVHREPPESVNKALLSEFDEDAQANEYGLVLFVVNVNKLIDALSGPGYFRAIVGQLYDELSGDFLNNIKPSVEYVTVVFLDHAFNIVNLVDETGLERVAWLAVFALGSKTEEYSEKVPKAAIQKLDEAFSIINDLITESSGPKVAKRVMNMLYKTRDEIVKSYGVEAAVQTSNFLVKALSKQR